MASSKPRLRLLGPADATRVARVASSAFHQSAFYLRALGFDQRQLTAYWDALFQLVMEDPSARVFALEDEAGQILAAVAVAYQGFPHPVGGLRFLARLLRGIGPAAWIRYLGFARAYVRVMHRPLPERRREACGLWLFVRPDARCQWLGSTVVRDAISAVGHEGKSLITGFVDASNRPLLAFYRRLGFATSEPFTFRGFPGATIELWASMEEPPAC